MEIPKVLNTITKKMETLEVKDNTIKWYACGPTVYDSPHIGHARTYIVFDTMRRVLEEYFGFDVIYVMNMTDIDDKIINKGNEILKNEKSIDTLIENLKLTEEITKISETVNDNMKASIFAARKYEKEFFDEMEKLNIKKPTFVTRVSEYIPQIIEYIEKIIENGFGYESNGSVYFDLKKYKKEHDLIFVKENAINDEEQENSEKKSVIDFALWKKTKPNELFFNSPWGEGRPGWHIECSAMASDIFPEGMDIHSGGVDLKFPHHENEIVQARAALKIKDWVKYFIHSGHLEINGRKMSKSLKNFITIPEILKENSPRTVRLMFLLSPYDTTMIYHEEMIEMASSIEKKIFNFLSVCETMPDDFNGMGEIDRELQAILEKSKKEIRQYFSENFSFHKVLNTLSEVVTAYNRNIDSAKPRTIKVGAEYIKKILSCLGLAAGNEQVSDENAGAIQLITDFRKDIRQLAIGKAAYPKFFDKCDEVREEVKKLGFLIEDKGKESNFRRII